MCVFPREFNFIGKHARIKLYKVANFVNKIWYYHVFLMFNCVELMKSKSFTKIQIYVDHLDFLSID